MKKKSVEVRPRMVLVRVEEEALVILRDLAKRNGRLLYREFRQAVEFYAKTHTYKGVQS